MRACPRQTLLLCFVTALPMAGQRFAYAAEPLRPADREAHWRALEQEMLEEINLLRNDPAAYANNVLKPLRDSAVRRPPDEAQPFEAWRVTFSESALDYIDIAEGDDEEKARAVVDKAIEALSAARPVAELERNEVLDKAARWFSRDYMQTTTKRPAHTDSLGRGPGVRLAAFGATARAIEDWNKLVAGLGETREVTVRVFKQEDQHFFVELPPGGGYRYWHVPDSFGEFVVERGEEVDLPRVNKPGHELVCVVDLATRTLGKDDASVPYPLRLPIYGENVVWGDWSRTLAARGLVCWWILDPGVEGRGHRKLLLDADFKYCGVGVTWSRRTGWVATLDVTSEPLQPFATTAAPTAR